MLPWLIVSLACLAALGTTMFALFRGGEMARPHPEPPVWLLPSPVDVRHERFPLVWQGYDPAHVDVFVDALAAAYEELYFASGPTAVARARARLEARLGVSAGELPEGPRLDPVLEERPAVAPPPPVRPVIRPTTTRLRGPLVDPDPEAQSPPRSDPQVQPQLPRPSPPPSSLRPTPPRPSPPPSSRQELEHGGGHRPGVFDG